MYQFNFSKEAAIAAGSSPFISEGGAYAGNLKGVKAVYGKGDSKSAGLEFGLTTPQGDASFLSIYCTKRDGSPSTHGEGIVSAMVAIARIQFQGPVGLEQVAQALEGKAMGLVLQKVLQMKADGVSETFKMDVKQVYHGGNMKTAKELYANAPAEDVAKLVASLTVRDDRKKASSYDPAGGGYGAQTAAQGGNYSPAGAPAFDEDLGW